MLQYILQKRKRLRDFSRNTARGFALMWQSAKKLTLINLAIFVLQGILPLLSLLILKNVIDSILLTKQFSWQQGGISILLFFGVQAATVIVTELSAYYTELHKQITSNQMAGKVLRQSVGLDLEYFENPDFYDELYMVQWQSLYRPAELIGSIQGFIGSLVTIVLFSGFLFSVHWTVPLLLLLLSIPLAISRLLQGYQFFLLNKNNSTLERRSYDLFDYLTSYEYAKEVRIFRFGQPFIHHFLSLKKAIFRKGKKLQNRFLQYNVLIQLFEIAIIVLIYGIIIHRTVVAAVSMGGLVVYLTTFQRLQGAISGFYQSCIHLFQQQLYLQQVLDFLSLPASKAPKENPETKRPLKEGLRVANLSFTYPQTSKQVLHNVSMQFPVGKVVAIVGENGSGKSTLVKLLSGLYQVPKDTLFWDGEDSSFLLAEEWRNHVTALFQDFGKYYLSIRENIAPGTRIQNEALLNKAAERSGFAQYLPSFSLGYRTPLGRTFKNGQQLSGGQWQKLALSRAFYKESPVLILDEPTSSLDPVSEYEVLKNLKEELTGERVIILISHRLYNLKLADYIYVLKEGEVLETGTFEDLLSGGGHFYNTYKTQMV
jgi:ATP-binding cassette, subfamily B, bacterial